MQTGDKIVIGYGDPDLVNGMASADGWFLKFEPDIADNEVYFSEYRNGTVVSNGGSRKLVSLERSIVNWNRLEINLNWYNVGNAVLTETYTDSGEQINNEQAKISADNVKGPQTGNKNFIYDIQSGGNGLKVEAGSLTVQTDGQTDSIVRRKSFGSTETIGTTGTWVPLFAVKEDFTNVEANFQINDLTLLRYSEDNRVEVIVKGFDEQEVTFTGTDSWSSPSPLIDNETVLQSRNDVDQINDNTGTLQSTTNSPGGYQLTRTVITPADQQFKEGIISASADINSSLFNQDIGVVLAKSLGSGDIEFELSFLEQW